VARLRKNRSEHLDPVLTKYGGRLVKLTGDGALVEFASAVDALSAAIEFQHAMAEANSERPTDTSLVFRMVWAISSSTAMTSMATASTWRRGWKGKLRQAAS
jgi:class 3 adenylate cyclase